MDLGCWAVSVGVFSEILVLAKTNRQKEKKKEYKDYETNGSRH